MKGNSIGNQRKINENHIKSTKICGKSSNVIKHNRKIIKSNRKSAENTIKTKDNNRKLTEIIETGLKIIKMPGNYRKSSTILRISSKIGGNHGKIFDNQWRIGSQLEKPMEKQIPHLKIVEKSRI